MINIYKYKIKQSISRLVICCMASLGVLIHMSFIQHSLKLSTTKLFVENQGLKFQTRIFADDLTAAIEEIVKKTCRLDKESFSEEEINLMKKYFTKNFVIKLNGVQTVVNIVSIRTDFSTPDTPVVVFEGQIGKSLLSKNSHKILIKNTLIFEVAPEQKNIVNMQGYAPLLFENEEDMGFKAITF